MPTLSAHTRPEVYTLSLQVDPAKDRFSGCVEIELQSEPGNRVIELNAVDLDFSEVTAADADGPIEVTRVRTHAARETVSLRLARGLSSASASVRIRYSGPLRDDLRGLYLARSGKRRYAATQLEAADARRFFPCFDEPDMKARFRISVTTGSRYAVVSNAPIQRTEKHGRQKTVHFDITPPLSTYLIALIVGELESSRARRCGKTPIRVWSVPGNSHLWSFALEAAVESLARLERYFGLPYPYAKLDLIAVPDFEFGAMENAGAVTFRESLLLVDPKTITLAEKKRVAEVIAHELAHMWYGDLVTMTWWDDLWLNEAFATWMAFTIVHDWKPEWQMWLDFEHGRAGAFELDSLRNTHPIYAAVKTADEATENFDLITYEKGAAVVRMLERWLGPATFRRGVRRYIRRHRESNARAADLWRALEETSGRDVGAVVRDWIERPGFPAVSVRLLDDSGNSRLELVQERHFSDPRRARDASEPPWPIPVVIRARPARGRTRIIRELMTARSQQIDLGSGGGVRWAYANADESGFYHPLHNSELLDALRADLNRLAPAERMGLISHQWAGTRADRAPLGELLDLINSLGDEPESEVLDTAIGPLNWLAEHAVPELTDADAQRFGNWLSVLFGGAFAELGWSPARRESDATRLRRASLLRLVGTLAEDAEVVSEAQRRIRSYLADRASLDPNLVGSVVELAARTGDKARYERFLRVMRRARTPQERVRFEMALASFRDPALLTRTLELTLTDTVPTQDVVHVLMRLLGNAHAREATWEFITTRWDVLSPRVSTGLATRLIKALPALQTRDYRREVAAFFKAHPIPSAQRTLKQALEEFDLNAGLRRRAVPALRRWLR
jgi:puromycin-sensitive aminopeptidase